MKSKQGACLTKKVTQFFWFRQLIMSNHPIRVEFYGATEKTKGKGKN